MSQRFPLTDPSLYDVLQVHKQDILASINCVKIGQIVSFDPAIKTAVVQILFRKMLNDGTTIRFPLLVDCPVVTLQGGGGAIQFPILAGDHCLVLFSDANIDVWFQTGKEDKPQDARVHHLSDGIAIVGLNATTSTLPAYDSHVNLRIPGGEKLVVSGGASAEILGTALLALKSDVDSIMTYLGNIVTAFNAHVHTSALPGNPTTTPTVPFVTTPPTMAGTTKLKGS